MDRVIGFIGGGQMAEALIKGLIFSNISPQNIYFYEPIEKRANYLEQQYMIKKTQNNSELVRKSTIVFLAVKPQVMPNVLDEIYNDITEEKLIVSIAAGLTTQRLEAKLPPFVRLIRVMPNLAATVRHSMSAVCKGKNATDDDLSEIMNLLKCIGDVVSIPEHMFDAFTAICGSGPAYALLFIEGMISAGIREGFSRDIATKLALQTVLGSIMLVKETGRKPHDLIDSITSPAGTTIEAIHHLEKNGLKGLIIDAVRLAKIRSENLN